MSTSAVVNRCSLAATLLLLAAAALALPDDSSQPINIQSDRASQVSLPTGEKTEYFGNVEITQGSMKINGDHIVIHSSERRVTSIVATGNPAQFEQQSDPAKAPIKAEANTLNYKLNNDTVVLTENAYIEQDGTTVSGNQIEYNIGSEQVRASGNKENSSRVKMVLIPKQKKNQDNGSTPAPEATTTADPSSAPAPTPEPTPAPEPTQAPAPTAAPAPAASTSSTPAATTTTTATPASTPTSTPASTPTPTPTPTTTPTPTPTPTPQSDN